MNEEISLNDAKAAADAAQAAFDAWSDSVTSGENEQATDSGPLVEQLLYCRQTVAFAAVSEGIAKLAKEQQDVADRVAK
jgi:hypothetical protein